MSADHCIRLIDTAGSELGIVPWEKETISMGDRVRIPDGEETEVIEVYDDEYGREGGVVATVVVDVD